MSKVLKRVWLGDGGGPSRRDRRTCEYSSYVPDSLVELALRLDGDVAADVADAEAAIAALNESVAALPDTEALARLLLRTESVASSRIEGLAVGPRRLVRAEAAVNSKVATGDVTAREVLGSIRAMVAAIDVASSGDDVTVDTVCGIHRTLLEGTPLEVRAGCIREVQNWIGGSVYNPCSAEFVPPPPELVAGLLADLAAFCNQDSLPAVVQAALAHAQFETIHPFIDGNGRTGRALIHLILRRRGIATRIVPPVSLVLAASAQDYVGGLTTYRYRGPATGTAAHEALNTWIAIFAGACARSAAQASDFECRARELEAGWRDRIGRVREGSSVDLLLRLLPGSPVVTVASAARMLERSVEAANNAIGRLQEAGVLRQVNVGRRNRAFEAPEVIDAFTELERRLGLPPGSSAP
jgi:Fic family protein